MPNSVNPDQVYFSKNLPAGQADQMAMDFALKVRSFREKFGLLAPEKFDKVLGEMSLSNETKALFFTPGFTLKGASETELRGVQNYIAAHDIHIKVDGKWSEQLDRLAQSAFLVGAALQSPDASLDNLDLARKNLDLQFIPDSRSSLDGMLHLTSGFTASVKHPGRELAARIETDVNVQVDDAARDAAAKALPRLVVSRDPVSVRARLEQALKQPDADVDQAALQRYADAYDKAFPSSLAELQKEVKQKNVRIDGETLERVAELLDWQKFQLTSWKGGTALPQLPERLTRLSNDSSLSDEDRALILSYVEARHEAMANNAKNK